MLARPRPGVVVRALGVATLLLIGLFAFVPSSDAAITNPAFVPRQCQNWGLFGTYENTTADPPTPDTIDRAGHRDWLLPRDDGQFDGGIDVPASAIMSNDNEVWLDGAVYPGTNVLLYTPPTHAADFTLNADGSFSYRPVAGYFGQDEFQYVWYRSGYCSQPATVTILAISVPFVRDDSFVVDAFPPPLGPNGEIPADTLPIPAAFSGGQVCGLPGVCGVLLNDENLDSIGAGWKVYWKTRMNVGDQYRTEHGWLTDTGSGGFTYRPDDGFEGEDWSTTLSGARRSTISRSGRTTCPSRTAGSGPSPTSPSRSAGRARATFKRSTTTSRPLRTHRWASRRPRWSPMTSASVSCSPCRASIRPGACRRRSERSTARSRSSGLVRPGSIPRSPSWPTHRTRTTLAPILSRYNGSGTSETGVFGADDAIVFLDVVAADDPPVAVNDIAFTRSGTPITIDVSANDSDPDGDLVRSSVTLSTVNSRWSVNPDGTITYTPEAGFYAGNTNAYQISDSRGVTADATVRVRVSPLLDDAYTVAEDGSLDVDAAGGVRANDAPPLGADPTVEVVAGPKYGTLTLDPTGAFDYVPSPNFDGQDSFTYRSIGGPSEYSVAGETATALITVTASPDAPVVTLNSACAAGADLQILCTNGLDVRKVFEGQAVRLRGRIDDPDHPASGTFTVDWGDGTPVQTFAYPCINLSFNPNLCASNVWYEPTSTWFGGEPAGGRVFFDLSHVYADDPASGVDAYTITVTPIDGWPSPAADPVTAVAGVANVPPTMSIAPDCGSELNLCLGFYSDLTVTQGTAVDVLGRVEDPGTDGIQLDVNWGDLVDQTFPEDCTNGSACPLISDHTLCRPTDLVLTAACGYVRLFHTYSQPGDYQVTIGAVDGDGGSVGPQAVTVHVIAPNVPPVADADTYSVNEDTSLTVTASDSVLVNDSDADGGQTLTATLSTQPARGTVTDFAADGSFIYTPKSNLNGDDTFTYQACDPLGACDLATVTIHVVPIDDSPVAADDGYTMAEDGVLTIPAPGVLGNDSDVDGPAITAALVGQPSKGLVVLAANGSFSYTPNANANGTDTFTYRAGDGTLSSTLATVTIHITPVNDPPTAANDSYSTVEDQTLIVSAAKGLLADDGDVDGDALSASPVDGVHHGTLTFHADGSFAYAPAANYFGSDSFTYRASDGLLSSTTATVSLTVTSANDLPTIQVVGGSCLSDTEPTGTIVVQVGDVETGSAALKLSATAANNRLLPANGLVFSGSGGVRTLTIAASLKQSGSGVVNVTVTDGDGGTAQVPINVIVGTAKADTISGVVGTDLIFGLAERDTISGGPADDSAIDVLCGGTGDDTLRGGAGNDVLNGGSGPDTLEGGDGNDQLWGGAGADVLRGEAGDDVLHGEGGGDQFSGGAGTDTYVDLKASEGDIAIDPAP